MYIGVQLFTKAPCFFLSNIAAQVSRQSLSTEIN